METALARRIGQAARNARRAAGKTQQEIADEAGVSVEFYSRIERGGTLPSVPTLVRLADVLDLGTDMLLGRTIGIAIAREKPRLYEAGARDAARVARSVSKLSPAHRRLILRLSRALAESKPARSPRTP